MITFNTVIHTFLANLNQAIRNKQSCEIGGGIFNTKELAEVYKNIQAMDNALDAARVLCANLDNGGIGKQTLIDNFRLLDESI